MTLIKAIETSYRGYRFRSRLEARWAVFFDEMGIAYEYEKEGYELPSGRYLPDFWLPFTSEWTADITEFPNRDTGFWIEIKEEHPSPREVAIARELQEATLHRVHILQGSPLEYMGTYFPGPIDSPLAEKQYKANDELDLASFFYRFTEKLNGWNKAASAARGARFEWGERGA